MCIQKDRLILNKHCMAFLKKRGTPPESFVLYMKNVSEKTKNGLFSEFLHNYIVGIWFRNSNARSAMSQSKGKTVAHHQKLLFRRNTWHRNYEILIVLTVPRFGMFCEPEVDALRESNLNTNCLVFELTPIPIIYILPARASKKWNEIHTIARFDSSASASQSKWASPKKIPEENETEEGSKLLFLFRFQ